MLIGNGDGTFIGGPLDIILVLFDEGKGTYHAAFVEENAPPGPVQDVDEMTSVRLRSKMHHTTGARTWPEAVVQLDELAGKIQVDEKNVVRDGAYPWDGRPFTIGVPNWRREGKTFAHYMPPPTPPPIESD